MKALILAVAVAVAVASTLATPVAAFAKQTNHVSSIKPAAVYAHDATARSIYFGH